MNPSYFERLIDDLAKVTNVALLAAKDSAYLSILATYDSRGKTYPDIPQLRYAIFTSYQADNYYHHFLIIYPRLSKHDIEELLLTVAEGYDSAMIAWNEVFNILNVNSKKSTLIETTLTSFKTAATSASEVINLIRSSIPV